MPPQSITLTLPVEKKNEFQHFLSLHQNVDTFREIDDSFSIQLQPLSEEEYGAFMRGVKEIFHIQTLEETCLRRCRDDSQCLNKARYGRYCWRHKGGIMNA